MDGETKRFAVRRQRAPRARDLVICLACEGDGLGCRPCGHEGWMWRHEAEAWERAEERKIVALFGEDE